MTFIENCVLTKIESVCVRGSGFKKPKKLREKVGANLEREITHKVLSGNIRFKVICHKWYDEVLFSKSSISAIQTEAFNISKITESASHLILLLTNFKGGAPSVNEYLVASSALAVRSETWLTVYRPM